MATGFHCQVAFQESFRQNYQRICAGLESIERLTALRDNFDNVHSQICKKNCVLSMPSHNEMVTLRQNLHELSLKMAIKLREPKTRKYKMGELLQEAQNFTAGVGYMQGYMQSVFNIHMHLTLPDVRLYLVSFFPFFFFVI